MTNYEANKEAFEKLLFEFGKVSFSVIGNEIQDCQSTHCDDCLFGNTYRCRELRKEWLKQEHKEED